MDDLRNTLDMIELNSSEERLEKELLGEESLSAPSAPSSPVTTTALDDRLYELEFAELNQRLNDLVKGDVAFGNSGLTTSAVAFKDLNPEEAKQVRINAIAISSFTNQLKAKLDASNDLIIAAVSLVTDDLYQARFQIDAFHNL